MLLTKSQAREWVIRALKNEVPGEECPEWLSPLIEYLHNNHRQRQTAANHSVASSTVISRFGQQALKFNEQLDRVVQESQMLASATEEMAATAHEIESLGQGVLEKANRAQARTGAHRRRQATARQPACAFEFRGKICFPRGHLRQGFRGKDPKHHQPDGHRQ